MKLNRNNYEEYFILYLDNELDNETRREVEAFAQENPDLKAELDMLMQSKLSPDTDISFTDKGALLRFDNTSISLSNYEEWLTSYIDNELTEQERKVVARFVAANPAVQKELNLLQQTKLQPEAIAFPYKESLYREEEKARVISIQWRRIAIAAALLLAIGTTAIIVINNKKDNNGGLAGTSPKKEVPINNTEIKKQQAPVNEQVAVTTPAIEQKNDEQENGLKKERNTLIVAKTKESNQEEKKEEILPVKNDQKDLIANNEEKKPANDIAAPIDNPNITPNDAKISADNSGQLTKTDGNSDNKNVTTTTDGSYKEDNGSVKNNPDAHYASVKSDGNNKGLRGFLRKVTRTFEKRTNIKATDDDDRLLVAGLAIKL